MFQAYLVESCKCETCKFELLFAKTDYAVAWVEKVKKKALKSGTMSGARRRSKSLCDNKEQAIP